jgi:hypothetical protein
VCPESLCTKHHHDITIRIIDSALHPCRTQKDSSKILNKGRWRKKERKPDQALNTRSRSYFFFKITFN